MWKLHVYFISNLLWIYNDLAVFPGLGPAIVQQVQIGTTLLPSGSVKETKVGHVVCFHHR